MAASSNLRERIVETLKQSNFLYHFARAIYRTLKYLPKQLLRRLFPSTRTFGLPQGFYSGIEALRTGSVPGKILLESQPTPTFAENTLVRLCGLHHDKYQPWPVFWFREQNAYLSGESLCLRNHQALLMAESTCSQTGRADDPAYWHFATRPQATLAGNVTSIVSYWGNGAFWHWLMDGVSRLALLPEFPPDTKILVPPLVGGREWFIQAMGLEKRCIETTATALLVENYYFSAPSAMTGCANPFAFNFLREQFLPKASARDDLPRRFYIGREGFNRGVLNEAEVREFFRQRGWGLVNPEKLTMPEKIELFSRADAVVAVHGSALTHLLWCSPGCRVVELNPENFLVGAFEVLARQLDLHHDFIICPADSRMRIRVDLAVLEQKLNRAGV